METGKKNVLVCLFFVVIFCFAAIEARAELVSWYRFEGNADDSAGANHGTVYGDPDWTEGKVGDALKFDGVGDYVHLGNDNSLKPPLPITISAWIKLNAVGDTYTVVSLDDPSSDYYGVFLQVWPTNVVQISYGDGGGDNPFHRRTKMGTTVLDMDTWYHVAAVVRGPTDMDLYVDGADEGTYEGTGGGLTYSSGDSFVGSTGGVRSYFDGIIDEVAIWNHALSPGEVTDIYLNGVPEPATVSFILLGSLAVIRTRKSRY
ncbi:MAG: LamG domain-containing protein [Sedimentisphaerales bacterium]|nr:LamG domain-containing protein [Sedimentisphaerales bacterium]